MQVQNRVLWSRLCSCVLHFVVRNGVEVQRLTETAKPISKPRTSQNNNIDKRTAIHQSLARNMNETCKVFERFKAPNKCQTSVRTHQPYLAAIAYKKNGSRPGTWGAEVCHHQTLGQGELRTRGWGHICASDGVYTTWPAYKAALHHIMLNRPIRHNVQNHRRTSYDVQQTAADAEETIHYTVFTYKDTRIFPTNEPLYFGMLRYLFQFKVNNI
jgi:hypothetical protein